MEVSTTKGCTCTCMTKGCLRSVSLKKLTIALWHKPQQRGGGEKDCHARQSSHMVACPKCHATGGMRQMPWDKCHATNFFKCHATNATQEMPWDKCHATNAMRQTPCDERHVPILTQD
eukprot:1157896-Pelagomonas_calceolata.AAC.14